MAKSTKRITKLSVIDDFHRLGISPGDAVLVKADLGRAFQSDFRAVGIFMDALLETVGSNGTAACLTYTKSFPLNKLDTSYVFDRNTPSTSGAITRLFLARLDCVRSQHPTCSIAAIGRQAHHLCDGHDENAPAYSIVDRLLEVNGKFLSIGCTGSNPGFQSLHWAQHQLGLTLKSVYANRTGVLYRKGAEVNLFKRPDPGECSLWGDHLYGYYLAAEKLLVGRVGDAYSLCIRVEDACKIDLAVIGEHPEVAKCGNPGCRSCRCNPPTTLWNKISFLAYRLALKLKLAKPYESLENQMTRYLATPLPVQEKSPG